MYQIQTVGAGCRSLCHRTICRITPAAYMAGIFRGYSDNFRCFLPFVRLIFNSYRRVFYESCCT